MVVPVSVAAVGGSTTVRVQTWTRTRYPPSTDLTVVPCSSTVTSRARSPISWL
ncbi:hypothetical protein ACFQL4_14065 [Halosimplex aquaticum]